LFEKIEEDKKETMTKKTTIKIKTEAGEDVEMILD